MYVDHTFQLSSLLQKLQKASSSKAHVYFVQLFACIIIMTWQAAFPAFPDYFDQELKQ